MGVVLAALSPHPPIIVPEIGKEEGQKAHQTQEALAGLARRIAGLEPDVLVLCDPHGEFSRHGITVHQTPILEGDFGQFGYPDLAFRWPSHQKLANRIADGAREAGLPVVGREREQGELSYAAMVPLYYLREAGVTAPLVSITLGRADHMDYFRLGRVVRESLEDLKLRGVVIASGDLSHRLKPGAPAGYDPAGKDFDALVVEAMREADGRRLLRIDPRLEARAGYCGLDPLCLAMGSVEALHPRGEVLSYEGPFGVGYAVAAFTPAVAEARGEGSGEPADEPKAAAREHGTGFLPVGMTEPDDIGCASEVTGLARQSLEAYVREGRIIPAPAQPGPCLRGRAGVFVTLHEYGVLRGCIGTIAPTRDSIAEEIIYNAIAAGTQDPRFRPVTRGELADLTYSVDILSPMERVDGLGDLDPRRYGVLVRKGRRQGLLLPDLEGIDTAEEQVAIAKDKAGIPRTDEDVELYRFTVERYEEP